MTLNKLHPSPDILRNVPISYEGNKYVPISHDIIIDVIQEQLDKKGIVIHDQFYRTGSECKRAVGSLRLGDIDNEIGFQIAWRNSVDGSMAFQIVSGSQVFVCSNGMLFGDSSLKRRHTGNNTQEDIINALNYAIDSYDDIYNDHRRIKDIFKNETVDRSTVAKLAGMLYLQEEIITETQLAVIKREVKNPSFDYNAEGSLWEFYNHCTHALKTTSPGKWINRHEQLSNYLYDNVVKKLSITIPLELENAN